jgi:hypothetical protein
MSTPEQVTLEKEALTKFRDTVNTILLGLNVADQHMKDTLTIKIANLPEGGDEAVTNVTNYYDGRAAEVHGNVKAVKTALQQMAGSADQILKLYNSGGQAEEISVDQVKNVFNSVLGQGQQPPGSVPSVTPPATPPARA